MVNKRGWIRIVEASLAIIIIFGVLIVLNASKNNNYTIDLSDKIPPLLEKIALNETLREKIVSGINVSETENESMVIISESIKNPRINYSFKICNLNEFCTLEPYPNAEVFAGERIISSSLNRIAPVKIKLFLWIKG